MTLQSWPDAQIKILAVLLGFIWICYSIGHHTGILDQVSRAMLWYPDAGTGSVCLLSVSFLGFHHLMMHARIGHKSHGHIACCRQKRWWGTLGPDCRISMGYCNTSSIWLWFQVYPACLRRGYAGSPDWSMSSQDLPWSSVPRHPFQSNCRVMLVLW